jgi:hypothetical protein
MIQFIFLVAVRSVLMIKLMTFGQRALYSKKLLEPLGHELWAQSGPFVATHRFFDYSTVRRADAPDPEE